MMFAGSVMLPPLARVFGSWGESATLLHHGTRADLRAISSQGGDDLAALAVDPLPLQAERPLIGTLPGQPRKPPSQQAVHAEATSSWPRAPHTP